MCTRKLEFHTIDMLISEGLENFGFCKDLLDI